MSPFDTALSAIEAWPLADAIRRSTAPKVGDRIEVIGYALADPNKRVLRVEYLFVGGKAYAFRSSPAN